VEAVTGLLQRRGRAVVSRRLTLAELCAARAAWVLGSLAGIMPVRSIGEAAMPGTEADLAGELRGELFRPA